MSYAWKLLKQTFSDFSEDDAMSLGGALAFYTVLSLAPLLILLLRVASLLGEGAQQKMIGQIEGVVGPQASSAIEMIIQNASQNPGVGSFAGIASLAMLILSASGVFAQLQSSLNKIWDVQTSPAAGWMNWVRKRLLSLGMIVAIAFILLVSLVFDAAIGMIVPSGGIIWQAVSLGVSLVVFTALFAVMYKMLPDVKIAWSEVWLGAGVTAVPFAIGKFLIGLYLSYSAPGSAYGAAGSLLILLLWVYYSSLLVFLGAEFTQANAHLRGAAIQPDENAEWSNKAKHHPEPS